MRHHVFANLAAARTYVAKVDAREGYPKPARFPSGLVREDGVGTTETFSAISEHPRKAEFGAPVVSGVVADDTIRTEDRDDADWDRGDVAAVDIGR